MGRRLVVRSPVGNSTRRRRRPGAGTRPRHGLRNGRTSDDPALPVGAGGVRHRRHDGRRHRDRQRHPVPRGGETGATHRLCDGHNLLPRRIARENVARNELEASSTFWRWTPSMRRRGSAICGRQYRRQHHHRTGPRHCSRALKPARSSSPPASSRSIMTWCAIPCNGCMGCGRRNARDIPVARSRKQPDVEWDTDAATCRERCRP